MNWRDDQVLHAVLASEGYASAAAALGLSHATVRACVERMEKRIGSPLFTHAPEGLTPTAAARALRPALDQAAATANLFARLATGPIDSDRGLVRVGVGSLTGSALLPRLWATLMADHPGLNLEIVPDYDGGERAVARGDLDIAIAAGAPAGDAVEGKRLGRALDGLYAHQSYLDSAGSPTSGEDLRRFAMIGPVTRGEGRDAFERMGLEIDDLTFSYRTDHRPGQVAAISAGLGIGYLPLWMRHRDPAVVRVLPQIQASWDFWLVTRRDMAGVRRIGLVRDALFQRLTSGQPP